jgi:hypothetical protein
MTYGWSNNSLEEKKAQTLWLLSDGAPQMSLNVRFYYPHSVR